MEFDRHRGRIVPPPPRPRRGDAPLARFFNRAWRYVWPVLASLALAAAVTVILLWQDSAYEEGLRFKNQWAFFLLALVPLVTTLDLIVARWKVARLVYSRLDIVRAVRVRGIGVYLRKVPPVLRGACVALVVLAIARPQATAIREESEVEGIDIVMTLDMSFSMKAADVRPTRLDAAKEVIDDFITRRVNDRIGMVVFGREAYTLCPPTLDYNVLRNLVADLELGTVDGRGTAIGNGVGTSINRLRKSDADSKAIVLLTDGSNNQGNISPGQAADFARALGIRIYTILMGREENSPVEIDKDMFGRAIFGTQQFPVNPELLRKMSERTGGAFYEANDRGELERSFHDILDALEKTKISDVGVVYAETFPRFLLPALILLLFELALRLTRLRKNP
jgi:Ca-activated chloride channel family protein